MLYDFIIQNYHLGEPIFVGDIVLEGMSGADRIRQLERLVAKADKVCRGNLLYSRQDRTKRTKHPLSGCGCQKPVYFQARKKNRVLWRAYACQSDGPVLTGSHQRRICKQ